MALLVASRRQVPRGPTRTCHFFCENVRLTIETRDVAQPFVDWWHLASRSSLCVAHLPLAWIQNNVVGFRDQRLLPRAPCWY
jgi:hypothetical protein